ncbi:protein kinase domain-containing protein [Planctomycetaceae bacterium SH139]
MSKLKTHCTHCDRALQLDMKALGKRVRCPHCQAVFKIANIAPLGDLDGTAEEEVLVTRSEPTPEEAKPQPDELAVSTSKAQSDEVAEGQFNQAFSVAEDSSENELANTPEEMIGRYQIKRVLGRGAFGVVYAAHDEVLHREVAIKLCSRERVDAEDGGEARLLAEARTAARLRHPNIVAVFEAGTHNQQVFIVSELVTGETLADRIKANPIPQRDAAVIVRDLARGLDYAHQQNLVHRDIKPQNVLIDREDRPQITDFGLAFDRSDEEQFREHAYSHSGTLAYMAPEQAGITGVSVGPAADQYALGATLFEMLTGQRPHQGNTLEILQGLEAKHSPRARQVNNKIDFDLDAVCAKAMSHEAWRRYNSCEDFARDLERYLAGDLIKGRRIGVVERVRHFSKRRPQVAAWIAAAAAMILAVFAYTTTSAVRNIIAVRELRSEKAQQAEENGRSARQLVGFLSGQPQAAPTANINRTIAIPQNPRELAGWVAYSRKLHKASRSLSQLELEHSSRLLGETQDPYRDWEHRFLESASGQPYVAWPLTQGQRETIDNLITFPDPALIGIHTGSSVSIRDLANGQEVAATTLDFQSTKPADYKLFPLRNQPLFVLADGDTIRFWDYQQSQDNPPLQIDSPTRILALTNDDRWLLLEKTLPSLPGENNESQPSYAAELWDLRQREKVVSMPDYLFRQNKMNFSQAVGPPAAAVMPDAGMSRSGNVSAVAASDSSFFLIAAENMLFRLSLETLLDNETPPESRQPELVQLPVEGVTRILTMTPDQAGYIWIDDQGNYQRRHAMPHGGWQTTLIADPNPVNSQSSWNAGKTRVATSTTPSGDALFASNDGRQLKLSGPSGKLPLSQRFVYGDKFISPEFSSNGRYLIAADGQQLKVWDLNALQPPAILQSETTVSAMAQSPDGRLAAIAHLDGQVDLWNLESDRWVWSLPGDDVQMLHAVAFHPTQPVVAIGGSYGVVQFVDALTGKVMNAWPALPAAISTLQFAPDGETLAIGLSDSPPTKPGRAEQAPAPEPIPVESVTVGETQNATQTRLVAFQNTQQNAPQPQIEANLLFVDTRNGQPLGQFKAHQYGVTALDFSPDGSRLVTSGEDGRVALWDVDRASLIADYNCQPGGVPSELQFSPDGERVVFVVQNGAVNGRMKWLLETRIETLLVTKVRQEMRTREVTIQKKFTVAEIVNLAIEYEGELSNKETVLTRTRLVPATETQSYMVCVPYTEEVQRTYSVRVGYLEVPSVTSGPSLDQQLPLTPHVVSTRAADLTEVSRWYPEGSAMPKSLSYAADGKRVYVTTDQGVSSLHPEYFFELAELRPDNSPGSAIRCGKVLYNSRYGKLLVSGAAQPANNFRTEENVFLLRPQERRVEDAIRVALRRAPIRSGQPEIVQATSTPEQALLAESVSDAVASRSDRPNPEDIQPAGEPDGKFDPWSGVVIGIPLDQPVETPDADKVKSDRLVLADTSESTTSIVLSRAEPTRVSSPQLLNNDRPFNAGTTFEASDYLPAPAGSMYQYDLPAGWASFHTIFALDSEVAAGAAVFVIRGDGRTLYRSPIIRDQKLHGIRLDVRGVKRLELISEYIDRGRVRGVGAWIQPQLKRELESPSYAVEFDELRITGTELDYCEIQLSKEGLKLNELRYTDPTIRVNGYVWKPKSQAVLPNRDTTKFISDAANFNLARIHTLRIGDGGNLISKVEDQTITLRFSRPANGSTDFECVIQIPRRSGPEADVSQSNSQLVWAAPWKVAGFALPEDPDQPLPKEIPIKTIRPFNVSELETIDWNWPEKRTALRNTPENRYAIVGQRQFSTDGGSFRMETLGDDAVRVRVNNQVVIDDWSLGGVRQNAVMMQLPPGEHIVRFEQFKPRGKSRLQVSVRSLEKHQFTSKVTEPRPMEFWGNLGDQTQRVETLANYLDREIAEQLRKRGVELTVRTADGKQVRSSSSTELPEQPFVVLSLWDGSSQKGRFDDETLQTLNQQGMLNELEQLASFSNTLTSDGLKCLVGNRSISRLHLGAKVPEPVLISLLSSLPNLREVDLRNPQLTDVGMEAIARLPLQYLKIPKAQISDVGLKRLQNMTSLTSLDVNGTNVTEDGLMQVLPKLKNLRTVSLDDLPVTDRTMDVVAKLPLSGTLSLKNTMITDAGLSRFRDMKVSSLDLSGTEVSDEGMRYLQNVFNDSGNFTLSLAGTRVTDASLKYLEGKPCWNLDLSNTTVGDGGIDSLRKLKSLRYLTLRNTQVSPAGIKLLEEAFPEANIWK